MYPAGVFIFRKRRDDDTRSLAFECLGYQINAFCRAVIDQYVLRVQAVVFTYSTRQAFGQDLRIFVDESPLLKEVFFQPGGFSAVPDIRAEIGQDLLAV